MKKIICVLLAMTMAFSGVFAQDAAKKQKPAAKKTEAAPAADKSADKGAKMKKDGTPDKRYKENKEAKPAAGPMKKDGTPDLRYKANKDASKKDAKPAAKPEQAKK